MVQQYARTGARHSNWQFHQYRPCQRSWYLHTTEARAADGCQTQAPEVVRCGGGFRVLRLYHCADARSFRCLWAMHELGVPCDMKLMPFPPRVHAPEYLQINPQGTVPTLVDGSLVMTESVAILQYLATRCGPTPLFVDPQDSAYGEWLDWLHYGETTLTAPQTVVIRYRFQKTEQKFRLPQVEEDYCDLFLERLQRVDAALQSREFLCADRFTMADISVGYALDVANYLSLSSQLPPAVKAYADRLRRRDGYRAARRTQAMLAQAGS